MPGFSRLPLVALTAGGVGVAIGIIGAWVMFSIDPRGQALQTMPATVSAHEQMASPAPSETGSISSQMQPEPEATSKTELPLAAKSTPQKTNESVLLPLGVIPDAGGDPEMYKRLPGVPQPIINRDGRDMTAEVRSMIQVRHEPQPFPGTANSRQTPVKALPFPKTQEEADRMVQDLNRRAKEANSQAQEAASPSR